MSGGEAPIPFLDVADEFEDLREAWFAAVHEIGRSGRFILGPNVEAFEREVAEYVGVRHAVGVASGTDALVLALRGLGVGAGDEVITTAFSFFATAEAITLVGADPVFVDVEPGTFNIDSAAAEAKVTARTRALLPVHLYGHPAPMAPLRALAERHGLALVEDCAQAFGARYGQARVGGLGAAGCFSFYPTKNLGGYGDGGMVTTDDAALAERLRRLRNHGASAAFVHESIGYNSRLDEIQAALLRLKLARIDAAIAGRRAAAAEYGRRLTAAGVSLPEEAPGCAHVYNLYTVRSREREALRARLAERGVPATVYYPVPLHRQPVYASSIRADTLSESERAADEVLSLPIFPTMHAGQVARVCEALAEPF